MSSSPQELRGWIEDTSDAGLTTLVHELARDPELQDGGGLAPWTQSLIDLGYLDPSSLHAESGTVQGAFPPELMVALDRFLADVGFVPPRAEGPSSAAAEDDDLLRRPGELELQELLRFTSFDGELRGESGRLPPAGAVNAYSRSLHYRLRLLPGLFAGPVDAPLGDDTMDALRRLAFLIGYPVLDPDGLTGELFDVLSDLGSLARWISVSMGTRPIVVEAPDGRGSTDERPLVIVLNELNTLYYVRSTKDLARVPKLGDREREAAERGLEGWRSAAAASNDPKNSFAVRVLQLILWTEGFYQDRLDGVWQSKSQAALDEALRFDDVLGGQPMHVPLTHGMWGLNGRYLLGVYFTRLAAARQHAEVDETFVVREAETLLATANSDEQREQKRSWFKRALSAVTKPVRLLFELGKKVYWGTKTLMGSALRALRKGASWVGGQLDELVGAVRSLLRTIARGVIQGLPLVLRGLERVAHFVFRKPVLTSGANEASFVASEFDFDADATLFVVGDVTDAELRAHSDHVRSIVAWTGLLLPLGARVMKVLADLLSGPIGWLRVALRIGGAVRASIRDWKQYERILGEAVA